MTSSSPTSSAPLKPAGLGPEERRRLGVFMPGEAIPVAKDGQPATSNGGVVSQWMDVTPAMAERWLRNNIINRDLNHDTVVCYARQMASGDFVVTHQGIAFNDADELIDGQHKLNAIIMSGVTVRMMVTFGLTKRIAGKNFTVMDVVDTGKPRTISDQFKIQHGIQDAPVKARICIALANLCHGARTRKISPGQALEVYLAFRPSVDFVAANRSKHTGLKAVGVLAGFAFAHAAWSEAGNGGHAERMFARLNKGEGLEAHPNLKLLHEFLVSDRATLFTAKMDRGLAELVLQVLHMEHDGVLAASAAEFLSDGQPRSEGLRGMREAMPERVSKVATLFKLPVKPEPPRTEPTPESKPAAGAPAPKAKRPSLDAIIAAAEVNLGIARVILLGRGSDADLASARTVVVVVARGCGYTADEIAPSLRRLPEQIRALDVGAAALTGKQRKAVEALKGRLGL